MHVNDKEELVAVVGRRLEDILRDNDRRWVDQRVEVLFPHKGSTESVDARDLAGSWLRLARQFARETRFQDQQVALGAAVELVRLSGIVPERGNGMTATMNLII
jgi:hypothetical protein